MVYESDFYTTRRPYSRPALSSYSVSTPRHYVVTDTPSRPRVAEENYSYSYRSQQERSTADPYGRNYATSSATTERTSRSGGYPGSDYSYTSERSSRTGDGPGSYRSSYSSTTSGRLPGGTTYRHFSYRV